MYLRPLYIVCVLCCGALLLQGNSRAGGSVEKSVHSDSGGQDARSFRYSVPLSHLRYLDVYDTVYVLGDAYIEISLAEQTATFYRRHEDTLLFKISSGSIRVQDGIATPQGIYSVQSKTPRAISRQYDNTPMLHWIGFNYNVGFHGLETNGYYYHLGKRPSSHGCVRMGREDIKTFYALVSRGTPVIVYEKRPARVLAFADPATFDTLRSVRLGSRSREMNSFMQSRLEHLYKGTLFASFLPRVYMDGKTQLRPGGYDVGEGKRIPVVHEKPLALSAQWNNHLSDRFHYLRPNTSTLAPAVEPSDSGGNQGTPIQSENETEKRPAAPASL